MSRRCERPVWNAIALLVIVGAGLGCGVKDEQSERLPVELSIDLVEALGDAEVGVETRRIDLAPVAEGGNLLESWAASPVPAEDGSKVFESVGAEAALQFSVAKPRDLPAVAWLGAKDKDGARSHQVEIEVNGKPVTTLAVQGGIREHRFVISESNLVPGVNSLVMRHVKPKTRKRTVWPLQLQALTFLEGVPIDPPVRRESGLFLPFGSTVTYLVEAPSSGALALKLAKDELGEGHIWARFRRFGEVADFQRVEVSGGDRVHEVDFQVGASTWLWVTISAIAEPVESAVGNGLQVDQFELRFRDSQPGQKVVRVPPSWRTSASQRPNVIIYLIDTLRADHLGCYGYDKPVSPSIDRFAADAVQFDRTMAQTSWTRTAVASIFTGMVPTSHGVIDRKDGLVEEAETLAEVLRGVGYDTASFVATGHVSPRWGMAQGFETFSLEKKNDMGLRYALSNGLNPPVIRWLERDRDRPFFLYVHTLDPHSPYAPTREAAAKFAAGVTRPKLSPETEARLDKMAADLAEATGKPAPVDVGSQVWVQALKKGIVESTPKMLEDLIALYDAEVYHNDIYFGELLDYLRESGLYDNTLIVFVADHGEEFLDHGDWTHGHTLYREQLQVPLIMRFPEDPSSPRGRTVDGLARQIDIAPTVADYLGVRAPAGTQGSSLLPMAFGVGAAREPRRGYAHLKLDASFGESFFDGRWKLICTDVESINCQLYDLDRDPLEVNDLAAAYPWRVAELTDQMRSYLAGATRLEAFEADPDEEIRQQLEALGYAF
jgi:arylsulfatase A-like enzyme